MGKHDKVEAIKFSWQPMPDDFYKARINTLEKENEKLRAKVAELEDSADRTSKVFDIMGTQYVTKTEYEEIVEKYEELEDRLVEECHMTADLKEALVRAALREV